MDELKPCPFCGGDVPELRGDKEFGWFIACFKCNIIVDDCKTEAEAIKAWNRRANDER